MRNNRTPRNISRIANNFIQEDNWEISGEMDNFLYVFDTLPDKMRLCVDLRMTGTSIKDISALMNITEREVYSKLQEAKKRFLRGENIL